MTPSDPERKQETPPAGAPERMPDPWGVKRAENLLTSLQGVLSARVEVSPVGEVTAVHVLTHAGAAPKQVVRNVESALLAQLGLKVDHRKISVAQTAGVKPIEALEQSAVREEALRRAVIFKGITVEAAAPHRVRVQVTLTLAGQELSATEEVADMRKARAQGAARAALQVLDQLLGAGTLELEGLKVVEEFDAELAIVGVQAMDGRTSHLVLGTAEVRDSVERAAVLAVLDATNRWVQMRT